jgi:hypothetical protein
MAFGATRHFPEGQLQAEWAGEKLFSTFSLDLLQGGYNSSRTRQTDGLVLDRYCQHWNKRALLNFYVAWKEQGDEATLKSVF